MVRQYKNLKTRFKVNVFSIIMLSLTVILILGITITLNYLWNYLKAYENHNPAKVVNDYVDTLSKNDFSEAVAASSFKYDYFNDEKAFGQYINTKYDNDFKDIKALKSGSDSKKVVYNLYSEDKLVSKIFLERNGKKDNYGLEGWTLSSEQIPTPYSVKVTSPKDVKVFLDGKEVTSEYLTAEKHSIKAYVSLNDQSLAPQFSIYEINNLLNKPVITISSQDSDNYDVTVNSDNTIVISPKATEKLQNELASVVKETAFEYAKYTTADVTFEQLSHFLYKDTQFYSKIKNFKNQWLSEHTCSYENEKILNLTKYDNEHFTASITFTYTILQSKTKKSYELTYNTSFIKSNGKWLLVAIY